MVQPILETDGSDITKVVDPSCAAQSDLLAARRMEAICQLVYGRGGARVTELSKLLRVSNSTVRRDIVALAGVGRLIKVHGGAVPAPLPVPRHNTSPPTGTPVERMTDAALYSILLQVVTRVEPRSSLAITAGPATRLLLPCLAKVRGLTIVTNAPALACLAMTCRADDWTVVVTGGMQSRAGVLTGHLALQSLTTLHCDLAAIDDVGTEFQGHPDPALGEVLVAKALVAAAKRAVLLQLKPAASILQRELGAAIEIISPE